MEMGAFSYRGDIMIIGNSISNSARAGIGICSLYSYFSLRLYELLCNLSNLVIYDKLPFPKAIASTY